MDAKDGWKKVTLPASWTSYGFDHSIYTNSAMPFEESTEFPLAPTKKNPVGLYRKTFTVKDSMLQKNGKVYITLGGVESAYYLYINGKEIGYKEALVRSSNVYMASAALAIGGDRLTEMAGRFMVGKELELDFGTVVSNWDLDSGNALETAQSAYGQGKILFSTIYGAMMAQAIANDGTMMKPYMVGAIIDQNGKCLKKGEEQVLSKAVSKRTARMIGGAMEEAARSYKMDDTYRIAAKTGTAQIGDADNRYEAWMVSFAPADNPRYVIAMNHCGTKNYGISLKKPVLELYGYLLQ